MRHRCPCTDNTKCGEEAELAAKLAKEGKLAMNYDLEDPIYKGVGGKGDGNTVLAQAAAVLRSGRRLAGAAAA